MAKPITIPRWSSASPGTTTVAPTSGKLDNGWSIDERPPAKYMNWLFYWIYQWIAYFSGDRVAAVHPLAFWTDAFWTRSAQGNLSTGAAEARAPVQMDEGAILKTLSVRVSGNASADLFVQMFVLNADGTATQDDLLGGTVTITNPGATWANYPVALAAPYTLLAGECVYVRLTTSAASLFVGRVAVGYTPGPV